MSAAGQGLSRRQLLVCVGAASLSVPLGCRKSDPISCVSVGDLTPAERQTRESMQYIDISPNREKICQDCRQWLPQTEDGGCGGCKVMKGPVHPKGTCRVFAPAG